MEKKNRNKSYIVFQKKTTISVYFIVLIVLITNEIKKEQLNFTS